MANRVIDQKIIDNNKRALLKYVIVADGSATSNVALISFSDLAFAINATGAISNTNPKASYGMTVKRIYGYSNMQNAAGYGLLGWLNDANSAIISFKTGAFDYNMTGTSGDGAVITSPAANTKGLALTFASPTASDTITLFVDLRKDSKDFDAGQTADPYAFNRVG